jgi:organic radical activating enzyme
MTGGVKLIECFRTFQGEGPDSGKAMLLLRFKYCDQNCFFCDTQVKMRISEEGEYSLNALQEKLNTYRCGLMITGGEPTWKPHYQDTMLLLASLNYNIANVETNGYGLERILREKDWTRTSVKFIYSPKTLHEKGLYDAIQRTHAILTHPNVYIKVPYMKNHFTEKYCKWVEQEIIARETEGFDEPRTLDNKVWLMPIGDTAEQQKESSADVMDACERYKFNFSGRDHIMYNFI